MHRFRVGRLSVVYRRFDDPLLSGPADSPPYMPAVRRRRHNRPIRLPTCPPFAGAATTDRRRLTIAVRRRRRYRSRLRRSRRFAARRFFAALRFLAALSFAAFFACRFAVARSSAAVLGVNEPIEEKPVT
jgi:hypothetical protein